MTVVTIVGIEFYTKIPKWAHKCCISKKHLLMLFYNTSFHHGHFTMSA